MLIRPRTTVIAGLVLIFGIIAADRVWNVSGTFAQSVAAPVQSLPHRPMHEIDIQGHQPTALPEMGHCPGQYTYGAYGLTLLCWGDTEAQPEPTALNDSGPELDPAVVIWPAPVPTRPECLRDCRTAHEARHGPVMRLRPVSVPEPPPLALALLAGVVLLLFTGDRRA